jgi:hypothetical protein
MKLNRADTRVVLQGDDFQVLHNTWNEYSNDQPLPTDDKEQLIDRILDLMEQAGDLLHENRETFKLSELARDLGVDPKVARDKFRRAALKAKVPESLKPTGWIFHLRDREAVQEIIRPKRARS